MTLAVAREKLHDLINHADEEKIFIMLSLFEPYDDKEKSSYTASDLQMLRERSAEYLSGRSKTFSPEASLQRIKEHRKHNGIL